MLKEDGTYAIFPYFIFLVGFVITYVIIPKILEVVHSKGLIDKPNDRSSHVESVPSMAGVAFFFLPMLLIQMLLESI